jgi:hypothetical protein
VREDGVEGAVPNGSGLAGLADRIDALAGTMQLLGPPGRGTRLFVSLLTGTAPQWQRAVVAGHMNEDLPDDPAILDPAGAGSLAGPSDQQIPYYRSSCRPPAAGAGAARGRPVA